ncbi:CDP-archaeol synthase [Jeotgalibaca porci]|uniref:CDP-archaeol synthase n=1 Tax=Jeotgalibaca porci TaxID=1868793 RepID=UPI00359F6D59
MAWLILSMYITLMPVVLAGIANMKVLKSSWLKTWQTPIDNGRVWRDGRPFFGANKTWRGAVGMVICSVAAMILWGVICRIFPYLEQRNQFYIFNRNTVLFNSFAGALLGVAYILFELPNSFIKRRMNISPGKAAYVTNPWKYMWLDQMDSLFGCALVLWLFYPLSFGQYLGYVFLGAATHLGINVILVKIGWKKAI